MGSRSYPFILCTINGHIVFNNAESISRLMIISFTKTINNSIYIISRSLILHSRHSAVCTNKLAECGRSSTCAIRSCRSNNNIYRLSKIFINMNTFSNNLSTGSINTSRFRSTSTNASNCNRSEFYISRKFIG